ncbi:MAG: hypothetical protein H6842_12680 [Rhodospirillaceae bacterium]|nr:hypothetical protein [Rhodospirillaceae bacterium]
MALDSLLYLGPVGTAAAGCTATVKAALMDALALRDLPDFRAFKCAANADTRVMVGPAAADEPPCVEAGIRARVRVSFLCLDKSPDGVRRWCEGTVTATVAALQRFDADALLIATTDCPVLLRRRGTVTLLNHRRFWDPSGNPRLLAIVPEPYRIDGIAQ